MLYFCLSILYVTDHNKSPHQNCYSHEEIETALPPPPPKKLEESQLRQSRATQPINRIAGISTQSWSKQTFTLLPLFPRPRRLFNELVYVSNVAGISTKLWPKQAPIPLPLPLHLPPLLWVYEPVTPGKSVFRIIRGNGSSSNSTHRVPVCQRERRCNALMDSACLLPVGRSVRLRLRSKAVVLEVLLTALA